MKNFSLLEAPLRVGLAFVAPSPCACVCPFSTASTIHLVWHPRSWSRPRAGDRLPPHHRDGDGDSLASWSRVASHQGRGTVLA